MNLVQNFHILQRGAQPWSMREEKKKKLILRVSFFFNIVLDNKSNFNLKAMNRTALVHSQIWVDIRGLFQVQAKHQRV